jgi:hypothetical protein
MKFGDGATLPFTPCKKGYNPVAGSRPMYACPLHDKQRRRRVTKEGGIFRKGEVDLNSFWNPTESMEPLAQKKAQNNEKSDETIGIQSAHPSDRCNDLFKKPRVI